MNETLELRPGGDVRLAEEAAAAMRPPRVLLAEDDAAMRDLLEEALVAAGYEVVPVASGEELLERVGDVWLSQGGVWDLVLSDVRMPGCTGLAALEALRSRDWATPVLFITAFGDPETHAEAARLGAEVLDKPFEVDDLLARVQRIAPPERYRDGWR